MTTIDIDPIHAAMTRVSLFALLPLVPFSPRVGALAPISAPPPPGLFQETPAEYPPSSLKFDELFGDAKRLAATIAAHYTDKSCVFLHTDELESEARMALVNVLQKGWLDRAKTRGEFFKVLKTAMCNRMRSLVQQHRFTQKRTGIKPPPKHERNLSFESCKPNEISLDDPNAHLQVGEADRGVHEDDFDTKELVREIKLRLCLFERLVFEQMVEPDFLALELAKQDSIRKQKPGAFCKITITDENKSQGLGINTDNQPYVEHHAWEKAVLRIQEVTLQLREMNPTNQAYELALDKLAELFQLQIPKAIPPLIVRRMLTIAARDNWQKVNPEVEAMLVSVGAAAPKFDRDSMQCYGVLYLKGHRLCESCGVKVSCSTRAANLGLGEITIHPKLLGAKLRRTPYVVAAVSPNKPLLTSSMRDNEIVNYLSSGKFKRVTHQNDLYFQPKDFPDKQKMLFCVGQSAIPLRLRFCNPSPALRSKLLYQNKGYYPSELLSAVEVIALISEHAKSAYV